MLGVGLEAKTPSVQTTKHDNISLNWSNVINHQIHTLIPKGWESSTGLSIADGIGELCDIKFKREDAWYHIMKFLRGRHQDATIYSTNDYIYLFLSNIPTTIRKIRTGFIVLQNKWSK